MLTRLRALAAKEGRGFGVKLTNTLGNVNDKGVLPGDEMYMSGRTLFPISTTVARRLSEVFEGDLPISYSGGVNQFNVKALYETGIHPITVATDMLRLRQVASRHRQREDRGEPSPYRLLCGPMRGLLPDPSGHP